MYRFSFGVYESNAPKKLPHKYVFSADSGIGLSRWQYKINREGDIMKRILYFILLIAELVVGFLLMSLVWRTTLYIPCVIVAAVWAALMAWQIVSLSKAKDAAAQKKILRNIVFVMLIPTAVFIVLFVWFIIAFMIAV
jgi:hypothetical protein